MTEDRDFKRLVRRRQAKTGESYAAARASMRPDARRPSVWEQWDQELRVAANDPLSVVRLAGKYLAYVSTVLIRSVETARATGIGADELAAAIGPRFPATGEPLGRRDTAEEPLRARWDRLVSAKSPDLLELVRISGTFRRYLEAVRRRAITEARSAGVPADDLVRAYSIWPRSAAMGATRRRSGFVWSNTSTDDLMNDLLAAGGPLRYQSSAGLRTRRLSRDEWPF